MNEYSLTVFDDLFDQKYIFELEDESNKIPHLPGNIANRKSWPYGKNGSHDVLGINIFKKIGKYIYFSKCPTIFMEAFTHIAENIIQQNFELLAIDSNMQVMSMDGTFHRDGKMKTIILYTTANWKNDWGGEFEYFEDEENNIIKKIDYVPGRVLYFDGNILHRAAAPLVPYVYRYSIAFRCVLL